MAMNDLVSDTLTRIRNGQRARLASVECLDSKLIANLLDVLAREGYIRGHEGTEKDGKPFRRVELKYFEGEPVIKKIDRVSKPGRREYSSAKDIRPVHNGLGISVLSTSKGVLSDYEARQQNVGGEVLCSVF